MLDWVKLGLNMSKYVSEYMSEYIIIHKYNLKNTMQFFLLGLVVS